MSAAAPRLQFRSTDVESWTVDDYARRMLARKHPVHRHHGVWWWQVRRRFCWSLDPFAVHPPHGVRPAWTQALAGYQIVVAAASDANAWFNPMVLDDVPAHGPERLDGFRRNRIRKGLKLLTVRPLNSPDELIRDGWVIEREFYERTRWIAPPPEAEWPAAMRYSFREPVIDHKLGAFAGDKLVAMMSWFGLGRTAHLAHIASGEEGNKACANDALLAGWLWMLRECGGYDRAVYTVRSFKPTLDAFKESHGFRMMSIPSRVVLNPLLRLALPRVRPGYLERLLGLDERQARDWIASARGDGREAAREADRPATPAEP
mgnify:CR=1 FL=1